MFRLRGGEVLHVPFRDAQRVIDRRGDWESPQVVWEVFTKGVLRRLWPEDVFSWEEDER